MEIPKLALLVLAVLASPAAAAREPPASPSLEARLRSSLAEDGPGGSLADCWGALLELRSCTNEIVLFFVNGDAYIGQACCRAIRIVTHQCWPTMLTSLGFTVEEGDILSDYCAIGAAPPPPPPPAPAAPPRSPGPAPTPAT